MTYRLDIMRGVADDLAGIRASGDSTSAARIAVLINEIKDDQNMLGNLLLDFYGEGNGERWTHTIGVRYIGEFARHRPQRHVWRFKSWDLENGGVRYRIIYAYFSFSRRFFVLAVAPRSWDYEYSHPLSQRIAADYDRLLQDYG